MRSYLWYESGNSIYDLGGLVTSASQFIHLHTHSEFSLGDGCIKVDSLIKRVKSFGHEAVAVTDHHNLFTAVDFYLKAKSQGVKAVIGAEVSLASKLCNVPIQYVLLAKTTAGYKDLMQIVSLMNIPGKTVYLEDLSSQLKNVFVIPSQHQGLVQNFSNDLKLFENHLSIFKTNLDQEQLYFEIVDNELSHQSGLNQQITELAEKFGIPLVATANAHYLTPDEKEAHSIMLGIKNDLTEDKMQNKLRRYDFSVFDPDTFMNRYKNWPEAIRNTVLIADQCNVEIETGKFYLPKFDLQDETSEQALERIAYEGLEKRLDHLDKMLPEGVSDELHTVYERRLDYELGVINKMGFPGYFLIVADFINWAKSQGIPVGPGRGSGAGSIVAYSMRITDIDPIPYNLIFERFLNPERISMPDFDVDFCQSRRDEVIQYVIQKYGKDRVAQITTFGKMLAKAAIRDVGRVMGLGYLKVDKIARLIPTEIGITLDDAYEREPRLVEACQQNPEIERLFGVAKKLEGTVRHTSVHAAGIVISDGPMTDYVPVYFDESNPETPITQYEMTKAEKVGLVKFDFLGLKTLTVIQKALQVIKEVRGEDIDIGSIPLDAKNVYTNISAGNTVGIFQLESTGMRNLMLKLKPSVFEDMIAVVALYRPGPLGSGMVDDFIERKHGRQEIEFAVPELEPILKETYGMILYQEQVQNTAAKLASYSLGEADILRRAMGKKKPEEMAKQKERFVAGCIKNNIAEKIATDLFDLMAKFAEYGFNKSHSAAYGLISYQTGYLKTLYTVEYMAAILTCDMDNTDKVIRYIRDLYRMKIELVGPDIQRSEVEFKVAGKKIILYGLGAIKGLGVGAVEAIVAERNSGGEFSDFLDMARRMNLHQVGKKNLELLVQCGAFDAFIGSRDEQRKFIPRLIKYSLDIHQAKSSGQQSLFDLGDEPVQEDDCDGYDTLKTTVDKKQLELRHLVVERKLMGIYQTKHPMELFKLETKSLGTTFISSLEDSSQKMATIAGVLTDVSEQRSKTNGKRIIFLSVEDLSGHVELVLYEDQAPEVLPEVDTPLVMQLQLKRRFNKPGTTKVVQKIASLSETLAARLRGVRLTLDLEKQADVNGLLSALSHNKGSVDGVPIELRAWYKKAEVFFEKDRSQICVPAGELLQLKNHFHACHEVKFLYHRS